jgi:large subunit ribosomal protein L9
MKVILLKDVAKIGLRHTIVNVPDGYGQNQLIPKGLAKPATPENLKMIGRLKDEMGAKESAVEKKFFDAKKALEGKIISIQGRKNDHGHLFAAIRPEEITAAAKAADINMDPAMVRLDQPIKMTGEHEVKLVHAGHEATFVISID